MWHEWTPWRVDRMLGAYRDICEVVWSAGSASDPLLPPRESVLPEASIEHAVNIKADIELAIARLLPHRRLVAVCRWMARDLYGGVIQSPQVAKLLGISPRRARYLCRLVRDELVYLLSGVGRRRRVTRAELFEPPPWMCLAIELSRRGTPASLYALDALVSAELGYMRRRRVLRGRALRKIFCRQPGRMHH